MPKEIILKHLENLDAEDYRDALGVILENLSKKLKPLLEKPSGAQVARGEKIAKAESSRDLILYGINKNVAAFTKVSEFVESIQPFLLDLNKLPVESFEFHRHPQLWQNTSRVAQDIKVENQSEKKSAFEIVEEFLETDGLGQFGFFSSLGDEKLRAARQEIQMALNNLEALRKKAKREFLFKEKNRTAKLLSNIVATWDESEQKTQLLKKLTSIQALISYDETNEAKKEGENRVLETNHDCLLASRDVDALALELKTLAREKNLENKDEVIALATQLDELTKRWLDPHFRRPAKLTTVDKVRFGFRIVVGVISVLAAIAALVLLFTPFAALAPILGLVSLVGLTAVAETGVNAVYNKIRYKRNPLRLQKIELIAAAILVPVMVTLSQISTFFHSLPAIIKTISDGTKEYGMHGFGIAANSTATGVIIGLLRGLTLPRVNHKEELKKHQVVRREDAKKILLKSEQPENVAVAPKKSLSAEAHSLWGKLHKKPNVYVFKDSEGMLRTRGSNFEKIQKQGKSIKDKKAPDFSKVREELNRYLKLDSDASLIKRIEVVTALKSKITEFLNPLNLDPKVQTAVDELKELVENEEKVLRMIRNFDVNSEERRFRKENKPPKSNNSPKESYQFQKVGEQKESEAGHLILSR